MNIYRVKYDLVVGSISGKYVRIEDEPVAQKLIVAPSFEAAVEKAQSIKNNLRPTSVNKECAIREIELVFTQATVVGLDEVEN